MNPGPQHPKEREVDQRELHLTLFACLAILILATGLAVLMYPAVFTHSPPTKTPEIAFFGFCGLSCLLIAYLIDRQLTIQKLRREIALDRAQAKEKLTQASAELLEAVPTFATFEDRLTMEFRRALAVERALTVFVIAIKLRSAFSNSQAAISALSDAARSVSRKLRGEDSIYVLRFGVLGVILPGVDTTIAMRVISRLAVGLGDAAGVEERFDFEIYSTNYPEHVQSFHDLKEYVCAHLPDADFQTTVADETQKA